ncbi:hypothetical protein [Halobellus rubicundus]|uniref:DUF222 domain-containing protein n=1 Tax=Halobellus rubicundus TaxID=2996466 RepID=A0ABD5MFH9_9EURY
MTDGADVTAEDALQVAQRALAKVNDLEGELEELRAEHEGTVEELTALRLRTSEYSTDRPYDQLTRDEKIGMVREHAFEKADDATNGRARLVWDDIKWSVFDGEPSRGHCYDLLRLAAGTDENSQRDIHDGAVGFRYRDPDDGTIHLAVDADLAKRHRQSFAANKTRSESGVR